MKAIRGLIVIIEMLIFAIGGLFIGLIIIPVSALKLQGIEHRKFCANVVHKAWKFFTKLLYKFGSIKIKTNGNFENINGKVIVANHPSLLDIVILIGLIPNCLCLAKKELLKNPIMHNIVKHLYIINDIDIENFQKETKTALENGFNIIIFPTGTRTLPNEELKIHKGSAQIAINANVDIVPITIKADYPILIKNHYPLDAGKKTITIEITKKDNINISNYKTPEITDIKLRKILSDKIKEEITIKNTSL